MNIQVTGKHGILSIVGPYEPSEAQIIALCEELYEQHQEAIKQMRKLLYLYESPRRTDETWAQAA